MAAAYVHGARIDEPLVEYDGSGNRRHLMSDDRGSIIAPADDTGLVLGVNRYDEYGVPSSGNSGRFQYNGQPWLPEIGMYYSRARMYDPQRGRFPQPDPIGYGDGANRYAYVGGDPVNWTDPFGLKRGDKKEEEVEIVVTGTRRVGGARGAGGGGRAGGGVFGGSEPLPQENPIADDYCGDSCGTILVTGVRLASQQRQRNRGRDRIPTLNRPSRTPAEWVLDILHMLESLSPHVPWARGESIEEANRRIREEQRQRDQRPRPRDGWRCLNCD